MKHSSGRGSTTGVDWCQSDGYLAVIVKVSTTCCYFFYSPLFLTSHLYAETGEGFFVFVRRRDARTLLPLIVQHIAPGSRVMSDMWAAYGRIRRIRSMVGGQITRRYHHTTVNHSRYGQSNLYLTEQFVHFSQFKYISPKKYL